MVTIGERISQLVGESRLQQKEVAEKLGIKIPTFNGYVNNIREPNVETLIRIADFFGVSLSYLVGHTDERNNNSNHIITETVTDYRLSHLDDRLNEFVNDPNNKVYLEIAMGIKDKLGRK